MLSVCNTILSWATVVGKMLRNRCILHPGRRVAYPWDVDVHSNGIRINVSIQFSPLELGGSSSLRVHVTPIRPKGCKGSAGHRALPGLHHNVERSSAVPCSSLHRHSILVSFLLLFSTFLPRIYVDEPPGFKTHPFRLLDPTVLHEALNGEREG